MTDKLIETNGKLIKQSDVFEKYDNGLSVTCGYNGIWLNAEEIELLAYWISKNFDLSFIPGFKEALEYRGMSLERDKLKEICSDNIDRMNDLVNMIKRLVSILEGVVEADSLTKNCLSNEAMHQIQTAITDAKKIQD